jgi:hypothetical protein
VLQVRELRVKPVAIANFDTKFMVASYLLQESNELISECMSISKDAAAGKRKLKDDRAKLAFGSVENWLERFRLLLPPA